MRTCSACPTVAAMGYALCAEHLKASQAERAAIVAAAKASRPKKWHEKKVFRVVAATALLGPIGTFGALVSNED